MKKIPLNWLFQNSFFALLLFSLNLKVTAQTYFDKEYDVSSKNNLFASGILSEGDSVIYVDGTSAGINFNYEHIVYKINLNTRDTIWTRTIADPNMNYLTGGSNTIIDLTNRILVCGRIDSSGITKPFLICYKKNGDLLWYKSINNGSVNSGYASMIYLNNKLYLGGYKTNGSNADFYIGISDTIGNIISEITYGNFSNEAIHNMVLSNDSSIILGGLREIPGPVWQGYIVSVDTLGNLNWENLLNNNTPIRVKSLSNGNILAFLATREVTDNFTFGYAALLDNLNNGSLIIDKTYIFNETQSCALFDVVEFEDNLYFTGGSWYSLINNPAGIMLKTNMNLDSLTSRWYTKRTNDHYLNSIISTSDGGFIMTGYIFQDSITNTQDGWLLRTNCIGALELPLANALINYSEINYAEQITLNNQSTEFESSITDWGDFSSDTIYSINDSLQTHQYTLPGQYEVTVTTIACKDTSIWQTTLTVLPQDYDNGLTVFPNPTSGNLNVWYNSQSSFILEVYDAAGKLVIQENIIENTINSGYNVNMSGLSVGVYLLSLRSEVENLQVKVVKSE